MLDYDGFFLGIVSPALVRLQQVDLLQLQVASWAGRLSQSVECFTRYLE